MASLYGVSSYFSTLRLLTHYYIVNGSDPRHKANREHFSKHITEKNIRPSIRIAKRLSRAGQYNAANNLQNSDNHYRELNELLYNVRSSRASLNRYLGTHHVISTDFWDTPESSQKAVEEGLEDRLFEGRRGQIPQWLDTQSAHVGFGAQNLNDTVALRIHHGAYTLVFPDNTEFVW